MNRFLVLLTVLFLLTGCFFKEQKKHQIKRKLDPKYFELSKYLISIQDIEIKYSKIFANYTDLNTPSEDPDSFGFVKIPNGLLEYYPSVNNVERILMIIEKENKSGWDSIIESRCYNNSNYKVREPIKKPAQRFKEKKFKGMTYKRTIPEDYYLFCYIRKWKHCYYNVKYFSGAYCEHVLADGLGLPESFYGKVLDNLDLRIQRHITDTKRAKEEAKRLYLETIKEINKYVTESAGHEN